MSRMFELDPGHAISCIIRSSWQLTGSHGTIDREQSVAGLVAKGELQVGETFVNKGQFRPTYPGVSREEKLHDGRRTFVTEVEGSIWISACGTLLVDPTNPSGNGYFASR